MIQTIENEFLIVQINDTGAELFSLKSKKTGIEYLWQGDAKYWKGRSPVLFPICGRLYKGKYTFCGKEYEMPIHGIARTAEFSTHKLSDGEIEFIIKSNAKTKTQYPFDFEFAVVYALKGDKIEITYKVKNNDKKDMPFSFGAHPAFNVPWNADESFEDYYIEFGKDSLDKMILSGNCFYMDNAEKFPLKYKKLPLKHELFDNDALFFKTETDTVKLKSQKSGNYIEISYNGMTCLGLWHVPKTDAPFVCIEPWHGIPSDEGKVDDLVTKRQMITLQPNRVYANTYTIKIVEK